MQKFSVVTILLSVLLTFFSVISYSAEDRENSQHSPEVKSYQKSRRVTEMSKPILPPVVPSGSSTISPTPSPHISVPNITSRSINMPHVPSVPSRILIPSTPSLQLKTTQRPMIVSVLGSVVNISPEKSESLWIEVKDRFGRAIKIKIKNLKRTPIVKQAAVMQFKDIKIGDRVNIMFAPGERENIASFINVLTQEEFELMRDAGTGSPVVLEGSQDSESVVAPSE
ncbi:hypothetical protein ACFL0P_06410 [Candidatus Omnitrophota bacterium]